MSRFWNIWQRAMERLSVNVLQKKDRHEFHDDPFFVYCVMKIVDIERFNRLLKCIFRAGNGLWIVVDYFDLFPAKLLDVSILIQLDI